MTLERWQLQQLQGLPLEVKIAKTKLRLKEWYDHFNGQVYVSFSGGKDSTVLLHIARQLYPNIEAVFVDTGLEYPEIRKFVATIDNVTYLKPIKPFNEIIKEYGYPIISKDVALRIEYARKGSSWAINSLKGLEKDGITKSIFKQRYMKYSYLLDAPFKTSSKCCLYLKENPCHVFEKQSKKKPIIGTMASESKRREQGWLEVGCNAFDTKKPRSTPIAFWNEKDIWQYIRNYNIPYSKIYDMGYERTGCMFCMFGCHLDDVNKFQVLQKTHPKQYDYCINKLGLGEVLDYIGVPYTTNQMTIDDFI